jgi:hypothetical protein
MPYAPQGVKGTDDDDDDAMAMRHIIICGLPGSTVFFHIIS